MALWTSGGLGARFARAGLAPLALLYAGAMRSRRWAYQAGLQPRHRLPLPAVGVGGLTVGGAGKTPMAAWIAQWFAQRGIRPAILLRGYGGDEAAVHRTAVPSGIVVTGADRVRTARLAAAAGARVLVLDDAFQHLRARPDLQIVLVSAESLAASPWPLPAGPWREGWGTLTHADLIVLTVKTAPPAMVADAVRALRARGPGRPVAVARLAIARLQGLRTGRPAALGDLAGRRVLAACGIADPAAFATQLRAAGAEVALRAWRDHHPFTRQDVGRLLGAARGADYVVVTAKDASKLRAQWPADAAEPLVAELEITWERGRADVDHALQRCLGQAPRRFERRAGTVSTGALTVAAERRR
jgi:tetraacyldisaccharide 4'-kinase